MILLQDLSPTCAGFCILLKSEYQSIAVGLCEKYIAFLQNLHKQDKQFLVASFPRQYPLGMATATWTPNCSRE